MNPPRRQSGVMKFLTDWWSQQHQVILHDESPQLPDTAANYKTKLCSVLNFCVCSGMGKIALQFRKNLSALLRPCFVRRKKITPPARSMLDEARLVLRFRSSYGSDAAMYIQSLDDAAETKQCPADIWYHLSYLNLSTFQFTLLPLHLPARPQAAGPCYDLVVCPDASFQSSIQQFSADMDFDSRWQVDFFIISVSE